MKTDGYDYILTMNSGCSSNNPNSIMRRYLNVKFEQFRVHAMVNFTIVGSFCFKFKFSTMERIALKRFKNHSCVKQFT